MTDHTPELQLVAAGLNDCDLFVRGERVGPIGFATEPEIAYRLAACWNACAGIPTEQLGDVKALVEALRDIHKAQPPRKANGYDDYKKFYFFAKGRARAALAPFRKD